MSKPASNESSPVSAPEPKPVAAEKSKYGKRLDAIGIQMSAISEKLEKLLALKIKRTKQNDKTRGFSDVGTQEESVDNSEEKEADQGIEAEVAQLTEILNLLKAQKELNGIFEASKEDGSLKDGKEDEKGGGTFTCDSEEEAQAKIKSIVDAYKKLGFECEVSSSKDGNTTTISVRMPEQFKGKNPLNMSTEELQSARTAMEEEKGGKKGVVVHSPNGSMQPTTIKPMGPELVPGINASSTAQL